MQLSRRQIYVIMCVSILCYMCLSRERYTGEENCDVLPETEQNQCTLLKERISTTQPKFVWVPDADLKHVDDEGSSLIMYEPVEKMTTRDAVYKIILDEGQTKIYLGFRPMENDTGVLYYVAKGTSFDNFDEYNNLIEMKKDLLTFALIVA